MSSSEDGMNDALSEIAGGDESLVRHMVENQVEPQERARRLREERGIDIDVAMVSTDTNAPGFLVRCRGCGREARLAFDPGKKTAAMCPTCQRRYL